MAATVTTGLAYLATKKIAAVGSNITNTVQIKYRASLLPKYLSFPYILAIPELYTLKAGVKKGAKECQLGSRKNATHISH